MNSDTTHVEIPDDFDIVIEKGTQIGIDFKLLRERGESIGIDLTPGNSGPVTDFTQEVQDFIDRHIAGPVTIYMVTGLTDDGLIGIDLCP